MRTGSALPCEDDPAFLPAVAAAAMRTVERRPRTVHAPEPLHRCAGPERVYRPALRQRGCTVTAAAALPDRQYRSARHAGCTLPAPAERARGRIAQRHPQQRRQSAVFTVPVGFGVRRGRAAHSRPTGIVGAAAAGGRGAGVSAAGPGRSAGGGSEPCCAGSDPEPPAVRHPVGLRLEQTLPGSVARASTVLGLRRQYGCFWITL